MTSKSGKTTLPLIPLIPVNNPYSLTPRERSIASLIATGQGNIDIARILGICYNTVSRHIFMINSKWGTRNRLEITIVVRTNPDYVGPKEIGAGRPCNPPGLGNPTIPSKWRRKRTYRPSNWRHLKPIESEGNLLAD